MKQAPTKSRSAGPKPLTVEELASFPVKNPNPVLRMECDGSLVYANPAGERLLETLGWRLGRKLPAALRKRICAASAEGQEIDIAAGGRVYAVACSTAEVAGGINLYFRDITARRHAEESLRRLNEELEFRVAEQTAEVRDLLDVVKKERQRLYDVLETLPAYVVLLSQDHHVPFANRYFEERFGKADGRRCYEYLFHRTEPCENCESFKPFETHAPHHWEWLGPDGRNYDIHDYPFTDADGTPLVMEMGIDVTEVHKARAALEELNRTLERRVEERTAELARLNDQLRSEIAERLKAEAELRRAKDDWERTFDTVPDMIAILDDRHRIQRVNRALAQALGVEPEQCVGQACYRCVHGTDRPPDVCPHVCTLKDGREHAAELHEERLKGDFLVTTTPMFDDSGKLVGAVHVARDITERKRAERVLHELNMTLEHRVAERTAVATRRAKELIRLAAELSHAEQRERTRLARLLHDDLQQLLLAARLRLAGIGDGASESARAALSDIDGLLSDCMTASRDLTMELSPPILHRGSLAEVLEWLAGWFGEKHGLDVAVEIRSDAPAPEHVRIFLFQAVRELLINARKHSGSKSARLALREVDGELTVEVEDGGCEFDPNILEKKLEQPRTFGLFSIRERLGALGGQLEFERTPAGGARFRMIVPASEGD